MLNKRGQIWIETVIYTLIALVMIGLVLTYAEPKIEEIQDKSIIEDSMEILESINSILFEIDKGGPGNKRLMQLSVKKGQFIIDAVNNKIIFKIESRHKYTEPGVDVELGNVLAHTQERSKINIVNLTIDYHKYNMTVSGEKKVETLNRASVPYSLLISNNGKDSEDKLIIDFELK